MRQAVESARMGWGLCTVAGVAGKGETLDVVPRFLITGRRIAGSSFGGVKGRDGVPKLVDRWLAGDIDAESFISHRITLDEVNKGFELMEAQDGIRSVIEFCCLERVEHPTWTSNAYLVSDGTHGVIVDSNGVEDPLERIVAERGIELTHVLITHGDGDHVVNPAALGRARASRRMRSLCRSGSLEIRALPTPGHCDASTGRSS